MEWVSVSISIYSTKLDVQGSFYTYFCTRVKTEYAYELERRKAL